MKLIFLDVDGVLNNANWAKEMEETGIYVYRDGILNPDSMKLLSDLVYQTGAKIILSSSWRRCPELRQKLLETMKLYGLSILDDTPYMGSIRGEDIREWLKNHSGISSYIILDDDDDMLPNQKKFLVRTDFNKGFNYESYLKALKILKGETNAQTRPA